MDDPAGDNTAGGTAGAAATTATTTSMSGASNTPVGSSTNAPKSVAATTHRSIATTTSMSGASNTPVGSSSNALGGIGGSGVNENAAELQFDPEFTDINILSTAHVAILLRASAQSAVNRDEELNEVYRKTQKYVDRFNTMSNPEKEHQEIVDELDNLQE